MNEMEKAVIFATNAHAGQVRKYTGEPYIFHPLDVARMAIELELPEWAVCAAILHDVIEDCGVTASDIANELGETVSAAVTGLTEISKKSDGNRAHRKAIDRDWYAMQLPEVQTLKVLDMISNTKSIRKHDPEFWKVYMHEKIDLLNALKDADKRAVEMATLAIEGYL